MCADELYIISICFLDYFELGERDLKRVNASYTHITENGFSFACGSSERTPSSRVVHVISEGAVNLSSFGNYISLISFWNFSATF